MTITERWRWPLLTSGLVLLMVAIARTAWVNDDAYITFRTLDNLVNGLGLTWNPVERVQAYTHPLWLLLLTPLYAITREPYFTSLALSLLLSLVTAWLVAFRAGASTGASLVALGWLVSSKAFTDYSTSGLENPLAHLLLTLFLIGYLKGPTAPRQLMVLAGLASLGMLTRTDLGLLYLIPLGEMLWRQRAWRALGALLVGGLPLLLWEGFSLVYYGFLFPNTAYAKLNTGIGSGELLQQGLFYLLNSWQVDPPTPLGIMAGVGAGLLIGAWRRDGRRVAVALGILLYLGYIVRIGGDFMSGRFMTVPLLAAVVLLVSLAWPDWAWRRWAWPPTLVGIVTLGLLSPLAPLRSGPDYGSDRVWLEIKDEHGIADERAVYFPTTGLWRAVQRRPLDSEQARQGEELRRTGPAVVIGSSVGFIGYYAGPEVFIVDLYALTDPLLARLPASETRDWRIGHFRRAIPYGYLTTQREGENRLRDQNLALYYTKLQVVTRGPLFDRERLVEIWRLNTGAYNHLIDYGLYRNPDARLRQNRT